MKKFFIFKSGGNSERNGQIRIKTINIGKILRIFRKNEAKKVKILSKNENSKRKMAVTCGALVCVFAALTAVNPAAKTVFNSFAQAERKLPIYCVDTQDKKVAISFDAACGDA